MRKDTSFRYRCSLCKEKFPFEDIKYSRDGKNIVCIPCYNKSKKKSKVNLRCPYCSGTRIVRDNITADKLLEEVSIGSI